MFISVHMIIRERTNLGALLLDCALQSLADSYYPSELVIVDNGSNDTIFDVYKKWEPVFNSFDCKMKVIKSEAKTFCDLRNLCLENTHPEADFFHWIDSDEIYYPEDLDVLKHQTMHEVPDISMMFTSFYHTMIWPGQIQVNPDNMKYGKTPKNDDARNSKDNIFRFHKQLSWNKEKRVHEKVINKVGSIEVCTGVEYVHYSYIRPQWLIFLKWLRYDMLEHGHLNGYKKENITIEDKTGKEVHNKFQGQPGYTPKTVEYLRNWRTPNGIIQDRRRCCLPYPMKPLSNKDYLPESAIRFINGCSNEYEWYDYMNKLDPTNFWDWWQDEYKKTGKWSDTLDIAYERAQKEGLIY